VADSQYNLWKNHFKEWRKSQKTQRAWSIEKNLPYGKVLYWFKKFADEKPAVNVSFIELQDSEHTSSGVVIQHGQWTISLQRNFDAATLVQCLRVLGGKSC
jgi:hypothetical protein